MPTACRLQRPGAIVPPQWCEILNPRGRRKPAGWYPAQSCAVALVNFVADFFPRSVLEFIRQPAALEGDKFPFPFGGLGLLFLEHNPQSLLRQRAKGRFLLSRDALDAFKKVVGDFYGRLHNMATHIRTDGHPYQAPFPNSESIFFRTASSILMSGGQARLKPSPGIFFVASKPILLPMAISLVAWSSTSDGPLVKMLSRCGSVLAVRWNSTSPVLWTFTPASTTTMYFVNIIWPMPQRQIGKEA